ncbi:RNI-like protein [Dentipellis sp. KUC8613]|nr:RNI-like protein [Dentipellis sp. KUC8613]
MSRKGKGVSRPLDIAERRSESTSAQSDIFAMSFDAGSAVNGNGSYPSSPPSPIVTPPSEAARRHENYASDTFRNTIYDDLEPDTAVGKGKGKDLPPTLPPLSFSPTQFSYDEIYSSPSSSTYEPGPSSFGSAYTSVTDRHSSTPASAALVGPSTSQAGGVSIITRVPSRRRSLSNLSIHSTQSLAARSMSRVKGKFGATKGPGALARKLFPRRADQLDSPSSPSSLDSPALNGAVDYLSGVDQGSCFMPWRRDSKQRSREILDAAPFSTLDLDRILKDEATAQAQYVVYSDRPSEAALLKGKGRSNSDPFPLPSAFDVVPSSSDDMFKPVLSLVLHNHFDEMLPRELRLHVLACLVQLHVDDHARRIKDGKWSVNKATSSKNKWVGRDQGVRELVRMSRVCKAWLALVFDGQLWTNLDLRPFPKIPASQLMYLGASAGAFIRTLDVAGHTGLYPTTLDHLTNSLALYSNAPGSIPHTRLTEVNLSRCSALTTSSLHNLLKRCPAVTTLRLKGLKAVTNETCELLHGFCPNLTVLDMSRCTTMTGAGIRSLATNALKEGHILALKELRLCGLKGITDSVMATLGRAAPLLEVLDLSYSRDLHNSSLEAFVACSEDDDYEGATVLLSSRQAGRDANDATRYRRRVTRLRHLSLSSCTLLTDIACSHLAHTMPRLEYLELAGIGGDLKDEGLIRLLETVPNIKKLDLEDASEITDAVLEAITPPPSTDDPGSGARPGAEPGHLLEHLVVSYAMQLNNEAFLALIRNCARLRVLEADNTHMSGTVLKEFVHAVRRREMRDAGVAAVDCRFVGESTVKELAGVTRPRRGWRAYDARKLGYLDARDEEVLGVGQDECDETRVVVKTFFSWQTVDAVAAARQKRRKSRREANSSEGSGTSGDLYGGRTSRWWSPSGRRSPRASSPGLLGVEGGEREGCTIM